MLRLVPPTETMGGTIPIPKARWGVVLDYISFIQIISFYKFYPKLKIKKISKKFCSFKIIY